MDNENFSMISLPRTIYLFCDNENETLYGALSKKVTVPMIPEFSDYLITELFKSLDLRELYVWSPHYPLSAYSLKLSKDESNLVALLNEGIKNHSIDIPKSSAGDAFKDITTFRDYIQAFGADIAKQIEKSYVPRFNPKQDKICDELESINSFILKSAGYNLYDAQLNAAEGIKRTLDNDNVAFLVAECGTGKSKIGAAAMYAHQKGKNLNVVLCPSHVCKKWVREIKESLPNTLAFIAKSVSDIDKIHEIYEKTDKTVFCILSKERARNSYMKMPSVVWSNKKQGFLCPHCGEVIMQNVSMDGSSYIEPVSQSFFLKENRKNHKCSSCGAVLWSALNPDIVSRWVKVSDMGFVYRKFAHEYLQNCKPKYRDTIEKICKNPDACIRAVGAERKYSLSGYIKKTFRKVDGLICDELHEYSGNSSQGAAMAELAGISDKVVALTGTLINGYALGMFYLLFRLKSGLMIMDNQDYLNGTDWCKQYGVIQYIFTTVEEIYHAKSRVSSRTQKRLLPGVSPLVYTRFMLNNTVFLSLSDLSDHLPEYEEIPIGIDLPDNVHKEYEKIEKSFKGLFKDGSFSKIINCVMSKYLHLMVSYPDQPYGHEPIMHPITNDTLCETPELCAANTLQAKDYRLWELMEPKLKRGEKIIIYNSWTRLDTHSKLLALLTEQGINVKFMSPSVSTDKREEWVEKQLKKGMQVLIVNPKLVETGIDLNAFTSLFFYDVGYNLYTFRQAARRSYRINQTAPRIEVYILYYKDTIQAKALELMSQKLLAAQVIEGHISDEGIAAMHHCMDMTSELARSITKGLKSDLAVLRDNFKRMAVLHDKNMDLSAVKPSNEQISFYKIAS